MSLLKLHNKDNVAVATEAIAAGTQIDMPFFQGVVNENIPQAHKVAIAAIEQGQEILKYGFAIGRASEAIAAGQWVHSHNLKTALTDEINLEYQADAVTVCPIKNSGQTFMGYRRSNNQVGIRNELWILPMVGCVNKTAEILAQQFSAPVPGCIDGVYSFSHPFGCSQLGDDHEATRQLLAGLARHPNTAGVLLLGLGCENNTMPEFLQLLGDYDKSRVVPLVIQQASDELSDGLAILEKLAQQAASDKREPIDIAELCIGLKCGGSDGLSGITANPLCGQFSDMLTAVGGSTLLTEVPEMFGAEPALLPRCQDEKIFDDALKMLNDFRHYYRSHNLPVSENPSPGNRDGGITTLEEKSLGCVTKGGHCTIVDVLGYAQPMRKKGLSLLDGPGNDIVAVTNLAAAGSHLILFTTGRGTPLGGPVPTLKIATNHQLAQTKKHWIDFDAAAMLDGQTIEEAGRDLMKLVIDIASGNKLAKNEEFGYREIAIFKNGVTL